jgi:hypothetical protein
MECSQRENWNHLFYRKGSFLIDTHCQFWGVGQSMKHGNGTKWLWYEMTCFDFVDRIDINPIKHEIKDTTYTDRSASYLDIHLEIESERRLRTKLYDKRDDFNFLIVNFPFVCSNILSAPAYGVYISRSPMYEVCLIRIQEQVDEKRSTGCTHRYTDCLLKNMPTKPRACWWYIFLILICVSDASPNL